MERRTVLNIAEILRYGLFDFQRVVIEYEKIFCGAVFTKGKSV